MPQARTRRRGNDRTGRIRARLLAGLAALLLSATAALATAGPAEAATCSGHGCDHQNPCGAGCFAGSEVVYDQYLGLAGLGNDPQVRLWYSPSCGTVWASIFNSVGPCCGGGAAYITRNSDRLTLSCQVGVTPVQSDDSSCYTNMLYDGNSTAYATGYQNGHWASTPSF